MLELEPKKISFIRTKQGKQGVPCLWENRTIFPTMTKFTKLFNSSGDEISPIYISVKKGTSLIPLRETDLILKIFVEEDGKTGISLLRVLEIDKYSNEALVEIVKRKGTEDIDFLDNSNCSETISKEIWDKISKQIVRS